MSTTEIEPEAPVHEGHDDHHPPDSFYVKIALVLGAITAAEVATYVVDLGDFLIPALMVMMVAKFALVVMFFMHLRFDNKLLSWVFVSGLVLAVVVYIVALAAFEFWS